ncbi:MAG: formylglycine-generating enzyme family protein [Phycisphaerales bacterium]
MTAAGKRRPCPVASRRPNPFGLYDMGGNVHEYVQDWFSAAAYKRYAHTCAIDPTGPTAEEAGAQWRVACGGGFATSPYSQSRYTHGANAPDLWVNELGFRVMIPAEAVAAKLNASGSGPR